jgi:WD40 repeat protein
MTTVTEALRSPYKGLTAFDDTELDALLFFGRERETEIVAANALASRLTVLYGPSGVGKSSLLRAGVVRSLRALSDTEPLAVAYLSSWSGDPVVAIEDTARGALADSFGGDPGDAPGDLPDRLDAWTAALGCDLVLIFDQFEELFLYHAEGGLLELLPELVTRPGLRVNVVLGIRDDELARLDVFKARIPGLFSNYLRLDLLDRNSARAAVLGPLERYNELESAAVEIEPALVESILGEVAAGRIDSGIVGRGSAVEEDQTRIETPYLQLVLQRLWGVERERRSDVLRGSTLAELGGAQQIVEDHLEHAMAALSPREQDVAAGMFDHLVTPSGAKIAHGVADLALFAHVDAAQLEPVLHSLSRERILRPTGDNGHAGDRYEIYHDVLAGAVLAWRARHDAERALATERVESRRRQRRLAIIAGISLVAFAVMAVLTIYAYSQRNKALAASKQTTAGALLQQSQAELSTDPVSSVDDALASTRIASVPGAEDVLRGALLANHELAELRAGGVARDAAYSPDASKIAVAASPGKLSIFAVPDGRLLWSLEMPSALNAVAWSPDGHLVAVGAKDGTVRLWDVRSKTQIRTLRQGAPVVDVAFSRDGRTLATAGGRTAKLWDAASGILRVTLRHARSLRSVSFSSDSRLLLTVSNEAAAHVWNVATGTPLSTLSHKEEVVAAAFGPGGHRVVTGSRDDTARIWNARTGKLEGRLTGHTSQVVTVAFSPLGDEVATGSVDGSVRLWSTTTFLPVDLRLLSGPLVSVSFAPDGQSIVAADRTGRAMTFGHGQEDVELLGQKGLMHQALFAPDGRTVATVAGSTVRLWEPYGEPWLGSIHKATTPATSVVFDPTGSLVASGDANGDVLIQRTHGEPLRTLHIGASIVSLAWAHDGMLLVGAKDGTVHLRANAGETDTRTISHGSPLVGAALRGDGAVVATAGTDGYVRLWDAKTGHRLLELHPPAGVTSVAVDPTGRLVAVGAGPAIYVYDARTGARRAILKGHTDTVTGLAFSPDGSQLVSSSLDHDARVWDARTLKLVKVLRRHVSFISGVAFSNDGRWVATAGPLKAGIWAAGSSNLRGSFMFFLRGNKKPIDSIAFSPRGWEVATASHDGSVRVFDCKLCGRLTNLESYAGAQLKSLQR